MPRSGKGPGGVPARSVRRYRTERIISRETIAHAIRAWAGARVGVMMG